MRLILLGAPGTGKGTVAKLLTQLEARCRSPPATSCAARCKPAQNWVKKRALIIIPARHEPKTLCNGT